MIPTLVTRADQLARNLGFTMSSNATVGALLAVCAAGVPNGGRILEIGTGAGSGLAWLAHGVGNRPVEIVSVESDPRVAAAVRRQEWPSNVTLLEGDILALFDELRIFDLIFADAQGGKWERLSATIDALAPGGLLVCDDMRPESFDYPDQREQNERVCAILHEHPHLVSVDIDAAGGVVLARRRFVPSAS